MFRMNQLWNSLPIRWVHRRQPSLFDAYSISLLYFRRHLCFKNQTKLIQNSSFQLNTVNIITAARNDAAPTSAVRTYTLISALAIVLLAIYSIVSIFVTSPPLQGASSALAARSVPQAADETQHDEVLANVGAAMVRGNPQTLPGLPQVDPSSDTDNTVNRYLLEQVHQGYRRTIAGGGWWGPTDQFFVNQLWGFTKSESGVFEQGDTIRGRVACLAPGGGNGYGTATNTLNVLNVLYNNARYRYHLDPLPNGQFITLESRGFRNIEPGFTDPVRTQCFSLEGVSNIFGNGIPVAGQILRTGIKIPWWFRHEKPVLDNTPAGFNVMGSLVQSGTLRSVPIAAQAWYQHTGYHYTVLDSAVDAQGRFIPAVDIAGTTVNGTVRFHWYAMRGAREESHGSSDFQTDIHHVELRVEEGGEDYTYFKQEMPTHGHPLLNSNFLELETALDTTILSDGWHVISFHSHAIDHVTPGAAQNMQLAAELKIPLCVENYDANACEGDTPPAPVPTPTPSSTPSDGTPGPSPTATPVDGTPGPTPTVTPIDGTPGPTPTATPTPVPVPPGNNLLTNGEFTNGLTGWKWYDVIASQPQLNGDVVTLPLPGGREAQLYQEGLQLEEGHTYVLRIRVSAATNESELGVYMHLHNDPYINFGLRETVLVNNIWSIYEFPFVAKKFDHTTSDARLRIRPVSGSFSIDSVQLIKQD